MRIVVGFKMFQKHSLFQPNNTEPSSVELIKWNGDGIQKLQSASRWHNCKQHGDPPEPSSSEREREGAFFIVIKIYQMEWWISYAPLTAPRSQIAVLWTTIIYVWIWIVCNEFGFNIHFKLGAQCFMLDAYNHSIHEL